MSDPPMSREKRKKKNWWRPFTEKGQRSVSVIWERTILRRKWALWMTWICWVKKRETALPVYGTGQFPVESSPVGKLHRGVAGAGCVVMQIPCTCAEWNGLLFSLHFWACCVCQDSMSCPFNRLGSGGGGGRNFMCVFCRYCIQPPLHAQSRCDGLGPRNSLRQHCTLGWSFEHCSYAEA